MSQRSMGDQLTWTVESGSVTTIKLSGSILEDSDFSGLLAAKLVDPILELRDVERVNSAGILCWKQFVAAANAAGFRLRLAHCSPEIVRQLSMIHDFAGLDGRVLSVYLPYYCDECQLEHRSLLELDASRSGIPEFAEALPCPRCGEEMEFDDMPSNYFAFL